MRDFYRDGQKAGFVIAAGMLLAFFWWTGVPAGLIGFLAGRYSLEDVELVALRDTVRITDSVYLTRTDTVVKYQRRVDTVKARSDSLDALVVIRDDSTLIVPDTVVVVPPIVVANLNALRLIVATQDTLIHALYQRDTTQQWRIATRDKLYATELRKANAPRWGYGATVGYGCNPHGCGPTLSVGVSYQARFPNLKQLVAKAVR